jgi:DNA-binding MarR family transcriptional regulator
MNDVSAILSLLDRLRPSTDDRIFDAALILSRQPSMQPQQIQQALGEANAAQVSRWLSALEVDGLIVRAVNANDKRRFDISLSAAGEQWVRAKQEERAAELRERLEALPKAAVGYLGRAAEAVA